MYVYIYHSFRCNLYVITDGGPNGGKHVATIRKRGTLWHPYRCTRMALIHQASARARVKSWRNVRHTDTLCLCVCVLIACCKTIRNYFCFSPVPSAVLICLLWTIQGTFLALNGAATLNQPTAQLVTEQWTWRRWTAQRINVRTLTVYSV